MSVRRWWIGVVFAVLCGVLAPAGASPNGRGGTPTGQHPEAVEAQIDALMHAAMDAIYRSHLSEAGLRAEEALQLAPNDPRVHLLVARVRRESFPDQTSDTSKLGSFSAPIHAACDRSIQLSDSLLAAGDGQALAAGYLYRGWAHLFRAQIHTLCDEYWSAGRQAKAGKHDLDRALELSPGNPDAQGVLGTYLYFADILPRVVKVARTVIRVPGGDRRRGLELLGESAKANGYNNLDARALIGVIAFAFDGDFDTAFAALDSLLQEYPDNPRLIEPLAVLELMRPERRGLERMARVAQRFDTHQEDFYRELGYRLTFYLSLSQLVQGEAETAATQLDAVRRAQPRHPDWFAGDVTLCLTETHLLLGNAMVPRALHGAAHGALQKRLGFATLADAAASDSQAAAFRGAQHAAQAIYAGDLEAARTELATLQPDEPAATFYRGECARLAGDARASRIEFEKLVQAPLPARWRIFKSLAHARLADLQGAAGQPDAAAKTLEAVLDYDADRDLFRHVMRARRRYWAMVHDGEIRPPAAATPAPAAAGNGDGR